MPRTVPDVVPERKLEHVLVGSVHGHKHSGLVCGTLPPVKGFAVDETCETPPEPAADTVKHKGGGRLIFRIEAS